MLSCFNLHSFSYVSEGEHFPSLTKLYWALLIIGISEQTIFQSSRVSFGLGVGRFRD